MPAGADVVVLEAEPEDDVPAEVPAEVELEPGVTAVVEGESGAGFVTCWALLVVDELPPLAFPPQPKAAIKTADRSQPASVGEKIRCMKTSRQ